MKHSHFCGINNIDIEKKERLIVNETTSNNNLINLNLNAFLDPRKKACQQFNEKYNENIDVVINDDIYNIVKEEQDSLFPNI